MLSFLTYTTILLYILSTLLWMVFLATLKKPMARIAKGVLLVAVVVHLAAIGWHHYNGLPPPILHPYSLLNLAAFILGLAFLIASAFTDIDIIGAFLVPVLTVVLLATISEQVTPGIKPVHLRFITPVHIACSALSFIGFSVAFVAGLMYVFQDFSIKIRRKPTGLPALHSLENLAFKSVIISFPFYTLGVILGTIWAISIPGSHPDSPQYLAGVISWWIYAVAIYGYISFGWRGRKAIAMLIAAYAGIATLVIFYVLRAWRQM